MALKDILVHVDNSKYCAARLEAAAQLASEHQAHLTGIYVKVRPQVPQFIQVHIGSEVIEAQREAARKAAEEAEKKFRSITDRVGIAAEWRAVDGDMTEVIALHARYSDLVVISQEDPDGDGGPGSEGLPDRVALTAGRPVMVIPYVFKPGAAFGRHIMVAWDSSRLATRAVNDAMPVLAKAKRVEVMAVNPHGGMSGHGDVPGADICLHLARHDVNAEAHHVHADDIDPGNMLLSRAADQGADMIVMGAYGHRRLRELVLGGVTRHMLQHMTVPVLMSH